MNTPQQTYASNSFWSCLSLMLERSADFFRPPSGLPPLLEWQWIGSKVNECGFVLIPVDVESARRGSTFGAFDRAPAVLMFEASPLTFAIGYVDSFMRFAAVHDPTKPLGDPGDVQKLPLVGVYFVVRKLFRDAVAAEAVSPADSIAYPPGQLPPPVPVGALTEEMDK